MTKLHDLLTNLETDSTALAHIKELFQTLRDGASTKINDETNQPLSFKEYLHSIGIGEPINAFMCNINNFVKAKASDEDIMTNLIEQRDDVDNLRTFQALNAESVEDAKTFARSAADGRDTMTNAIIKHFRPIGAQLGAAISQQEMLLRRFQAQKETEQAALNHTQPAAAAAPGNTFAQDAPLYIQTLERPAPAAAATSAQHVAPSLAQGGGRGGDTDTLRHHSFRPFHPDDNS